MALTGTLRADFSEFVAAVTNAEKHLTNMSAGADRAGARLNAMQDSFSGKKIIQDATLMTAAVERAGGASVLTAKEMARVNATVTEAIAKYAALGQQAPQAMTALADATKRVEAPTQGLSTKMVALGTAIGTMAANALTALAKMAVEGIGRLVTGMGDLILSGAGVADVGENFARLTTQAGLLGSTLLGTLRSGTHNTITDFELMKTVNQDLAAGMRLTDTQFGTLAKGAFALAQATGTDVKGALDTMNDAMLTGRTRALALLTGKIDLEVAETKYAASIGKLSKNLNEAEKLEAARAAILDGVTAATKRLGEQTDGLDERIAQATTAWANFKHELGAMIATSPVVMAAFDSMAASLKSAFGESQDALVKNVANRIENLAITLVDVASVGVSSAKFIAEGFLLLRGVLFGVLEAVANIFTVMTEGQARVAEFGASIPIYGRAWTSVAKDARFAADAVSSVAASFKATSEGAFDSMGKVGASFNSANEKIAAMRAEMVRAALATTKLIDANDQLGRSSGPAAEGPEKIGKAAKEATVYMERLAAVSGKVMVPDWFRVVRVELEGTTPLIARTIQETSAAEAAALKWAQANGAVLAPSLKRVSVEVTEVNGVADIAKKKWTEVGSTFSDIAAILDHLPGKFFEIAAVAARTGKAIADNLAKGDIFGAVVSGITGAVTVLGRLFTDQNKAQVQKYNAEIETLRAGLLKTHGTLDALEAAGQRVGISFRENWGHQGAAGLKAMNDLMQEFERRTEAVGAALVQVSSGLSSVVSAMTKPWIELGQAGEDAKQQLDDLGIQAVASFGAAMVAGKSYAEAIALIGPSTATIGEAFRALGIDVEDVGLKHLILQSTVATGNPALIAAASGLGSSMQGLAQLGMLNAESFAAMQRTGTAMYVRLQGEVANLGGDSRDALLPMQDYLHQAATQAELLGIPLDENTQRLIDQSRELGIWQDKGKSAQDILIEGMQALVDRVDRLLTNMLGFSNAITNLPARRDIEINVTENVRRNITESVEGVDWGGPQAKGGDYFVTRPTLFLAGEAGPERATFSGANRGGDGGGAVVTDSLDRLDRLIADLPRAIGLAVSDALILQGARR